MHTRHSPFALLALGGLLLLGGCDAPATTQLTRIEGAQFITFRCVVEQPDGVSVGLPLDRCGCSRVDEASGQLVWLGRVQCRCRDALDQTVRFVRADPATCAGGACQPALGDDGDWIPIASSAPPNERVACVPQRAGQVRAYVGSNQRGEVAVLDLTGDDADGDKQVLDVDRTIPGVTAVFVDDLISDVGTHPDGRFVFTVNATSGTLSVIREDRAVREAFKVDLGAGPLLEAAVWPPVGRPRPMVGGAARAFVSAPQAGTVLELDLDALGAVDDPEAIDDVVVAVHTMPGFAAGQGPYPGRLSIDPRGTALYVGDAQRPQVTAFDLTGATAPRVIDLTPVRDCDDAYLRRVVPPEEDDTCQNGVDDDGDGLVDGDDPDCAGEGASEALRQSCRDGLDNDGDGVVDLEDPDCQAPETAEGGDLSGPRCPSVSECADGADNDEDGLTDLDDPDCGADAELCDDRGCVPAALRVAWERPLGEVPACGNGLDDDGDGLVDRFDPGCAHEADTDEADPATERSTCGNDVDDDGDGAVDEGCTGDPTTGPGLPEEVADGAPCQNGVDDDADGLVDAEDPGCNDYEARALFGFERTPGCADGEDDDRDGLVDFGSDPDCYAASDTVEAASAAPVGPADLVAVAAPLDDGARHFLYAADPQGVLALVDLDDPTAPLRRVRLGRSALTLAARERGIEASVLLVADDASLRSIEVTAPTPVLTRDGRPIFAHLRRVADGVYEPVGYYTVEDGFAWTVTGLDLPDATYPLQGRLRLDLDSPVVDFELAEDEADREPFSVLGETSELDRGRFDPQVFLPDDRRRVLNAEANVRTLAQSRTNRVATAPRLLRGDSTVRFEPNRFPGFCRLDQPDEPAPELCVPVGYTATGERESAEQQRQRTQFSVAPYEGVQVTEDDPEVALGDTYTLAFEGELPRSTSRTGQFGGREGDQWTLLDYGADFCRVGVEVGDVVLVDNFVPRDEQAAQDDLCQRLSRQAQNVDVSLQREPLRYEVVEVYPHKLVLRVDPRDTDTTYQDQVSFDGRTPLPRLLSAPPAPTFACAAQFIQYRVRAGVEQWVLSGRATGYRHPWVDRGGLCVEDEARLAAGRVGRTRLGELFQNEWFRFRLGALRLEDCPDASGCGGVPADAQPFMLDVRYEFDVASGFGVQRLADAAVLAREMRWSPADDHLYIVDAALETVAEIAGLNVFDEVMRQVRTFR